MEVLIKEMKTTTTNETIPHKQGKLTSHKKYQNKTVQLYQTNIIENQEAHEMQQNNTIIAEVIEKQTFKTNKATNITNQSSQATSKLTKGN